MTVSKLVVVKEELEEVIDNCATARYSLDDAHKLSKLAMVLEEEARLIIQCCS